MNNRALVLSGISVLACMQAAPALAQAEGGDSSARAGTDIIVTARRTEERLQDVPVAIAVISQQQLANRNIVNGADLAITTPSLSVSNSIGSLSTSFSLRGFFQQIGTDPSVGVYFADAPTLRGGSNTQSTGNGAGPGSFFDLQNIQVLKGPQGTLFGRNSTGGAILLVPQKPTDRFEGYAEGSYGNYNMYRGQAVINVPLGEMARLRVGVDRMKRDGYVKNVTNVGPRDFNDVDFIAARASLVVDLTPDLETYIIASYQKSNTNGDMLHIYKSNLTDPGAGLLAFLAQGQLNRYGNAGNIRTTANSYEDVFAKSETWQLINTTTWRASDAITVKNIISYGQLVNDLKNPLFGNAFDLSDANPILRSNYAPGTFLSFAGNTSIPGGKTAQQSTFSEEFRLEGNSLGGALRWQTGVYFEAAKPLGQDGSLSQTLLANCPLGTLRCAAPIPSATPGFAGGSASITAGRTSFRNVGVYAQGSYDLTDKLVLTLGARYTWTKVTNTPSIRNYFYAYAPAIALTPQDPIGYGCVIGVFPDCAVPLSQKSQKPTWTVGLDYKPTPDILTYAKWSRGFRQGGISAVSPVVLRTFEPETVDAYEVGVKTSWNEALKGTFNVAAFYNDLKNQQTQVSLVSRNPGIPSTISVVNAGKSRVYGLEVDTSVSPFTGFVLDASYAYLNSKIKSVTIPAFTDPIFFLSAAAIAGDPLTYVPKHKLAVTGTYTLPLDESLGRLSLSATYSFTSRQAYSYTRRGPLGTANAPSGELSDTSISTRRNLVDAAISWSSVGGSNFDLTVFGSNITNKKYEIYNLDTVGPGGFQGSQVGLPRLYGVRARYNF